MSVSLQVDNLAKAFASILFENVNLAAHGVQKIALIGDNGSGKSTLLKILAGLEFPDFGSARWSNNAKIGYLDQEIISENFAVSGGEQKIIKISQLFFSDNNVLLLDEPDNHLDLEHKSWFEKLVLDFDGIVIVISHDRNFLKNAIDTTWHLEEGLVKKYPFGYEKFKNVYEEEMESRQHLWKTQEKERLRLLEIVKQFRVKAAKNDGLAKQLHSAEKRLIKFTNDMVKRPPQNRGMTLNTDTLIQHKRKTALYLKGVSKSYGDKHVLKNINLHLFCKDKISISAPNGSGKSTLINIITGKLIQDSGELILGDQLKIGYYAQQHLDVLDENLTLVEELQKSNQFSYYASVACLKKFLFNDSQIKNQVRFLSGGQKSRLQLAKFLSTNPDILILDEPTNHLDLRTVLALETFLREFEGTLILVSHDIELTANVVDTVYHLSDGSLSRAS